MENTHKSQSKIMLIIFLVVCGVIVSIYMLINTSHSPVNNDRNADSETGAEYTDAILCSDTYTTEGITYDVYYLYNNSVKPIAIFQHGLTGSRKDCSEIGKYLARQGFYVICPDAAGHGDTETPGKLTTPQLVVETSKNVDIILNHLSSNPEIDHTHIYYAGFSLGAMSAYHYAAYGTYKLTAIAACCGTPDFEELIGNDIVYNHFSYGTWEKIRDTYDREDVNIFLKNNSPLNHRERLYSVNILMQTGEKDTTIPPDGSFTFYNDFKQQEDNDLTAILTTYPTQGHEITDKNVSEIIEYFLAIAKQQHP